MPLDYEISDRFDQDQEKHIDLPYRAVLQWIHPHCEASITRYERRLGRLLRADEGQVLLVALTADDPQETLPRFFRCADCGDWIDRGAMGARRHTPGPICDLCQIPF